MSEEYLTLVEDARDSLRAMLVRSEPGTGAQLHTAYNSLKSLCETLAAKLDSETDVVSGVGRAELTVDETREQWMAEAGDERRRKQAWRRTPFDQREQMVLALVERDGRMTVNEIYRAFMERFPEVIVHHSALSVLAKRMIDRGELDRVKQPAPSGPAHFVYFRKARLEGTIADLDQMFKEGR